MWSCCCSGGCVYFSSYRISSDNLHSWIIGKIVILALVSSKSSLILHFSLGNHTEEAAVLGWPQPAAEHPESCSSVPLSGVRREQGEQKWENLWAGVKAVPRVKERGEGNKWWKGSHQVPACRPMPSQFLSNESQPPYAYTSPVLPLPELLFLSMTLYHTEYPCGQFGSVILFLRSQGSRVRKRNPWGCVSSVLQQPKHWSVASAGLVTNPKQSPGQAAMKKTNSFLARQRLLRKGTCFMSSSVRAG